MARHVHPDPVCGFGAHRPHDPSCTEMDGRMIACGESDRPDWPYPGRALCGHADGPFFNPEKWNAILVDLLNNNCYNTRRARRPVRSRNRGSAAPDTARNHSIAPI
jgi:hypothetical protein